MIEYLDGTRCRRVVLDADMDGDSTRTSCRTGEQFCDVCYRQGRKRIRIQVHEEEDRAKRVRLQDVTAIGQRRKAEQQALQLAEDRGREDAEREQSIRRQEKEAKDREEARTAWMRE
jgi:hypothetical protein